MKPRDAFAELPVSSGPGGSSGRPDRLAEWLIARAARNAPPSLSSRLHEEWLADMAARQPGFSRLCFALGCCWAIRVIASEHLALGLPAAAGATGRDSLAVLPPHYPSQLSGRTAALIFIVSLHLLVIYGFASGFAQRVIESIPQPMHTRVLNSPREREFLPSPMPDPRLAPPRRPFPNVLPDVVIPDLPGSTGPTIVERVEQPLPPQAPPKTAVRVLGGPGRGFPNTSDFYPAVSRRAGEAGIATVRVCVDPAGRLSAAPSIEHSSGSARLDGSALALARAGSGHYRSTTEDGRSVSDCYPFRVRFELRE